MLQVGEITAGSGTPFRTYTRAARSGAPPMTVEPDSSSSEDDHEAPAVLLINPRNVLATLALFQDRYIN